MPRDHTSARPSAIPAELVLAAIERADRHRARDTHAVPAWAIFEHMGIARRSAAARHVRGRLEALQADGKIESVRLHSIPVWEITAAGRRYLQRERRAGIVPELPESPQHQAWRNARTLAGQEIERIREELIDTLTDAMERVERESPSDRLLEIAARLHSECRRLGSAVYCLSEWVEPDDAHPDIDERLTQEEMSLDRVERARLRARRAGRRNFHSWSEHRATGENN